MRLNQSWKILREKYGGQQNGSCQDLRRQWLDVLQEGKEIMVAKWLCNVVGDLGQDKEFSVYSNLVESLWE